MNEISLSDYRKRYQELYPFLLYIYIYKFFNSLQKLISNSWGRYKGNQYHNGDFIYTW